MTTLAWQPKAWESGLIPRLSGPTSPRHIVWNAKLNCAQGRRHLYIFDALLRPAADAPVPLICVLLDEEKKVAAWAEVAPYSSGFLNATLDGQNVLTVSASANWFHGKGVYRYKIECDAIDALGDGEFSKFDDKQVDNKPAETTSD